MTQLTLFDHILRSGMLYTACSFVSNGYVAVSAEIEHNHPKMAALVDAVNHPETLPAVFPVCQLPPIQDLPQQGTFVHTELYELICRQPYAAAVEDGSLSYYRHTQKAESGQFIPIIAVYADDILIGFVAGMYISPETRPAVSKELKNYEQFTTGVHNNSQLPPPVRGRAGEGVNPQEPDQ